MNKHVGCFIRSSSSADHYVPVLPPHRSAKRVAAAAEGLNEASPSERRADPPPCDVSASLSVSAVIRKQIGDFCCAALGRLLADSGDGRAAPATRSALVVRGGETQVHA